MCNPNWTALECILSTYLIQILFIGLGLISGLAGLFSRDIASTLTASQIDQKPLLVIKGFEFNPQLNHKMRLVLQYTGFGLIAVGLIWWIAAELSSPLITRSNSTAGGQFSAGKLLPVGVSLAGVTYISGDWNPRQINLRTAASDGIYMDPQASFRLADLEVLAPEQTSTIPYQLQAIVYANGEKEIGETKIVDLVPGLINLGDVNPTNFQHATIQGGWLPQKDWEKLTIALNILEKGQAKIAQSIRTDILLTDQGRAWFQTPPYASLSTLVYQINNGQKMVLDLRSATDKGIPLEAGDKLRIWEIWVHALADDNTRLLTAESYVSSGIYDKSTALQTPPQLFKKGVYDLLEGTPLEWTIPKDKNSLVITLARNNDQKLSVVLDRYIIPFSKDAPAGLVTVPSPAPWPQGNMTYLDFEGNDQTTDWTAADPVTFGLSSQFAVSGKQSLAITVPPTSSDEKQETVVHKSVFQASLMIGQIYWPSQKDVRVAWAQICVTRVWQCAKIPVETGRWNTFFMDLSSMQDSDGITLDQIEFPSFFIQGSFVGDNAGTPYTFYLDGIQVYATQKP